MKEFLTLFTLLSPICILNAQNGITTGILQYKQTIVIDTVLNSTKETIGTLYFDTQKQHSLYVWDKKIRNIRQN